MAMLQSSWVRAGAWSGFFAAVLAGWALLFGMAANFAALAPLSALGPGMAALAPLFPETSAGGALPAFIDAICSAGASPGESGPLSLSGMWALMALAMMMPTAVPLFRSYGDLVIGNPTRIPAVGLLGLLAGFAVVWLGFAGLAGLVQWGLSQADILTAGGILRHSWLTALLLALAGLYQFSSLKAACLSRCRAPLMFFLSNWRDGLSGAFLMGLQQGLFCLGCCWALMALAFVGGTMNLIWMGAAMLLMILEKLPFLGRHITAPLGLALMAASILVALFSFSNT